MADAETTALVLAGGGARGAYEIGALSELLPALEREGHRPTLIVGTSIGALNAALIAATAHRSVAEVVEEGRRIWRDIRFEDVLSPLPSIRMARKLGALLADVLGGRGATSLLDTAPLGATLAGLFSFADLRENAAAGRVRAAVVTTSATTSRSVVFHTDAPSPPPDAGRGIDYVCAELGVEHVMASAAIPVALPAVSVASPPDAAGWYFDGGTRLNAPIAPAVALGAARVVVVALNSVAARPAHQGAAQPDLAVAAGQLLQAVLVDPLATDVAALADDNRAIEEQRAAGSASDDRRPVPYVFVAPREADTVGRLAARVFAQHYGRRRDLLRSPSVALLGRIVSGGRDAAHGELLSYLFVAPQFTEALFDLGRADAQRWLRTTHESGIWRVTRRPPT